MKFNYLDIKTIKLDLENPRLAEQLESCPPEWSDEQKEEWAASMLCGYDNKERGCSASELQKSIVQANGIIEPIIVQQITNNKYLCIEGNTRLSIYRELIVNGSNPSLWKDIPALIYPKSIDKKIIDDLRLQAHFVGKKEWKPYAKGKYIVKLLDENRTLEEIVQIVGGRTTEIQKYAMAYKDWQTYYEPLRTAADADTDDFSQFIECRKKAIQECLTGTPPLNFTMKDFAKWVKAGKLPSATKDTRDKLADVLRHDEARIVFLEPGKTCRDAVKKLPIEGGSELLDDANIDDICNKLLDLINEIKDSENEIKSLSSKSQRSTLNKLYLLSNNLLEILESVESIKNT